MPFTTDLNLFLEVHKQFSRNSIQLQAKVVVTRAWVHTVLFYLAAAMFAAYILTRVHYLVWRLDPVLSPSVDIPYSWLVVLAEVITSLLTLYTRQYFRKQTVEFKEMKDSEVRALAGATPSSCPVDVYCKSV